MALIDTNTLKSVINALKQSIGTKVTKITTNSTDNEYPSAKAVKDYVTESAIPDNSISTVKIQNNAVTSNKIKDGAVTKGKIDSKAVGLSNLDTPVNDKLLPDISSSDNGKVLGVSNGGWTPVNYGAKVIYLDVALDSVVSSKALRLYNYNLSIGEVTDLLEEGNCVIFRRVYESSGLTGYEYFNITSYQTPKTSEGYYLQVTAEHPHQGQYSGDSKMVFGGALVAPNRNYAVDFQLSPLQLLDLPGNSSDAGKVLTVNSQGTGWEAKSIPQEVKYIDVSQVNITDRSFDVYTSSMTMGQVASLVQAGKIVKLRITDNSYLGPDIDVTRGVVTEASSGTYAFITCACIYGDYCYSGGVLGALVSDSFQVGLYKKSPLPAVTSADVGKVLTVDSNGNWVAILPS